MGQMDGKVAIVTGSGRGIGKEIALRLVRDGAKVVINDIDDAPAKETVAEIEKLGGKAVACNGDVAKPDFGDRIVKTAVDAFGDCHVVVNNAGYTWDSVIQKMSDEQWYAILDVHLTAPFRILRAFQQHFRQAVEKERSEGKRIVRKVVNISSTSGVNGNAGQSNYSAGKAGIVGLTKTLAKEFGRYDVTVNAVAFGYIQTRLTQPLSAGRGRRDRGAGPQGQGRRAGRPHRRHEPDDPARPRRPAGRGGRLGLSLLQPRQRLCQRPVPGGERRALIVRLQVGVVGCGVAGQAAAILLADAGHAVTVFERFAEPRPIGAGLLLQPTGLAVLRELGLADAAMARGARVVGLEAQDAPRPHRARSALCRPASQGASASASGAACCSTCCTAGCCIRRHGWSPARRSSTSYAERSVVDETGRDATARSISWSWPTARIRRCARG